MIFVFAGTSEGRQAAKLLQDNDKDIIAFVTTRQGVELLQKEGISGEKIHCGRLDLSRIKELIEGRKPDMLVDATHPFAVNISKSLIRISEEQQLALVRIERPRLKQANDPMVYGVPDVASAADLASELGQNIFLTIGSKAAGEFAKIAMPRNKRVITRVMPSDESVNKCLDAGFDADNILTGYGPFSLEDNIKDFQDYHIDVIVTKDSGVEGGVQEKIDAALQLSIKVVLIERPPDPYKNISSPNITTISAITNLKV